MPQLEIELTKEIEIKNQLRVHKAQLKDILEDNQEYQDLVEKGKGLNTRRRQILESVAKAFPNIMDAIEEAKAELKNQRELVSDVAINQLLRGEPATTMHYPDQPGYEWQPVITVKYKKVKTDGHAER